MRLQMDLHYRRACAAAFAIGCTCAASATASPGSGAAVAALNSSTTQGPLPTGPLQDAPGISTPVRRTHSRLGVERLVLNVLYGRPAIAQGILEPHLADRMVVLQVRRGQRWVTLARTLTGAAGRFRLRYVPYRVASSRVRIHFAGDATDFATHRSVGRLNAYREAVASWYGGGGSLACGSMLTSSTLGVANKTLPCGTIVTLRYRGHTIRVPVVDRGPYVSGREFDLTEATKRALGFEGVGEVLTTS